MSDILATLKEVSEINQKTLDKLDLIQQLSRASKVRMGSGLIELDKSVVFNTIYANNATVTIATYPKTGSKTPKHCHDNITEYLICTKGSVSVSFDHGYRILHVKDCVSVPGSSNHTVTALEDSSELIAVCVPVEETYKASMVC